MAHIHLIGIGGTGLSAIARVLLERGESVSGSDRQDTPALQALQAAGARVFIGHRASQVRGANLVLRSSAIYDDNVEVQAAHTAGIPVLKRVDFLEKLTAGQRCIAVAGTHGKTTTTAMIAWALTVLDQDPSFIIGSEAKNLAVNARAGQGDTFVIEADEYDYMFLGLHPHIAVVTNIEHDHPDCFPTEGDFYQAFLRFAGNLAPGGMLLACNDDHGARRLLGEMDASGARTLAYGLNHWLAEPGLDYFARLDEDGEAPTQNVTMGSHFTFVRRTAGEEQALPVSLKIPGRHNVQNAVAALAVIDLLGLPLKPAIRALGEFSGTGRRFEVRLARRGIPVIDDYAHHPTEIRATLAAVRAAYPQRAVWAVWQPHTYTRTRLLLPDFAAAFGDADHVLVTPIFAAREAAPEDGFSARQVSAAIDHADAQLVASFDQAVELLLARLQPDDVLIVLSAGDATLISARVLAGLDTEPGLDIETGRNANAGRSSMRHAPESR